MQLDDFAAENYLELFIILPVIVIQLLEELLGF